MLLVSCFSRKVLGLRRCLSSFRVFGGVFLTVLLLSLSRCVRYPVFVPRKVLPSVPCSSFGLRSSSVSSPCPPLVLSVSSVSSYGRVYFVRSFLVVMKECFGIVFSLSSSRVLCPKGASSVGYGMGLRPSLSLRCLLGVSLCRLLLSFRLGIRVPRR